MSRKDWGRISPRTVSDLMSFDISNKDWRYSEPIRKDNCSNQSMADKQTEGVAYLWNILSKKNVALLADEVGMGKTFQAIGVICLLWKMKPDAKVLVMAPNQNICHHWENEYRSFINRHYRENDNLVKSYLCDVPVNEPRVCKRLKDLANETKQDDSRFFLTTISSLSNLIPPERRGQDERLSPVVKEIAADCRKVIISEQGTFDLIIIDESHYFRNVDGGSQRVAAAESFFGPQGDMISDKFLLLTATPSHSGLQDIPKVFSYFLPVNRNDCSERKSKELLQEHALRRFRLMYGKGAEGEESFFNKYMYRDENELAASFEHDTEAELFFALYQKKLVTELKAQKNGRKFMYGYLEGFESFGGTNVTDSPDDNTGDEENEKRLKDSYSEADDSQLLRKMTAEFRERFGRFPNHPKYTALVNKVADKNVLERKTNLHENKHLIFVRRIPSVREITQRVNQKYDSILVTPILHAWGIEHNPELFYKWKKTDFSRKGFEEMIASKRPFPEDNEYNEVNENQEAPLQGTSESVNSDRLGSRIANLFVVKKKDAGDAKNVERTDCTNVSLRFRKPESIFSLFLEPSSDYESGQYCYYYHLNQGRVDYSNSARDYRIQQFESVSNEIEPIEKKRRVSKKYEKPLGTAWGLIYEHLTESEKQLLKKWGDGNQKNRECQENFSNYIKEGFLFSSPVMVEIYCWFTLFNNRHNRINKAQEKYLRFLDYVRPQIQNSMMLAYFKEAISSFEALCEKIEGRNLSDWQKKWTAFRSLQNPAAYASGEVTSRQRLITGFNSPFYPNVLTATSVFQEGVNLHLQCNHVHHYGIAWTPGDNEQRVGRVDRLFGKVNNLIKENPNNGLEILYPYLSNSFDEDQVASFIKRKSGVEKKMDACLHTQTSKEIDSNTMNWKKFLNNRHNKRHIETKVIDPYPARFEFDTDTYEPANSSNKMSEIIEHVSFLVNTITTMKCKVRRVNEKKGHSQYLFLIEPTLKSGRHQPVLVELNYSSDFSAMIEETVFYITLKTPLGNKEAIELQHGTYSNALHKATLLDETKGHHYPLVQLAVDSEKDISKLYMHMKVDFPLFTEGDSLYHLSLGEVECGLQQLATYADFFERDFYANTQDLSTDDLSEMVDLSEIDQEQIPNTKSNNAAVVDASGWNVQDGIAILKGRSFLKQSIDQERLEIGDWFQLNHKYPFLSFDGHGNVYLAYPVCDLQENERVLLEKWFDKHSISKK
jgi:superfamily II DNA or RNA helicase